MLLHIYSFYIYLHITSFPEVYILHNYLHFRESLVEKACLPGWSTIAHILFPLTLGLDMYFTVIPAWLFSVFNPLLCLSLSLSFLLVLPPPMLGKAKVSEQSEIVELDGVRLVEGPVATPLPFSFTFGMVHCGAPTYLEAWKSGTCSFIFDSRIRSNELHFHPRFERYKLDTLATPDVVVFRQPFQRSLRLQNLDRWLQFHVSRLVIVFHTDEELQADDGQDFRVIQKRLQSRQYITRTYFLEADACGAPSWAKYVITVGFHESLPYWDLPSSLSSGSPFRARPSQNILQDYGISRKCYSSFVPTNTPSHHSNCVGLHYGQPVYSGNGPLGADLEHSWVYLPTFGVRRPVRGELLKVKGYVDSPSFEIPTSVLASSVEVHVWATLSPLLVSAFQPLSSPPVSSNTPRELLKTSLLDRPRSTLSHKIEWTCPDLSEGSPFNILVREKLREALAYIKEHNLPPSLIDEEEVLAKHRLNYSEEGPKHLVNLWWMFPRIHWEELRLGASMNFMETPKPGLVENQLATGDQLALQIKFVDGLIDLGVLAPEKGYKIVNNFPLFLAPKPKQPGEYRCIADGKRGGQNNVCVSDPCQMTQPHFILPYLYTRGWSCILDMSKYFHMFLTRLEEQQHLGIIHPLTKLLLAYMTFPMGTRNSPPASGRFGGAFIRLVKDTCEEFQGVKVFNTFVEGLQGLPFDPDRGLGVVLIGKDNLPALLLWLHIDDMFVHGPTLAKLQRGLTFILDLSVKLGLIIQPAKTVPPSQFVEYCGFIYDTRSAPRLVIPPAKVSRALALVSYLLSGASGRFARLIVAMVVGLLQSLVYATPAQIGSCFLRSLYDDLHSLKDSRLTGTRSYYYTIMDLSPSSVVELEWWQESLDTPFFSSSSRPSGVTTLILTWGDGSGTGTGGSRHEASFSSIQSPHGPPLPHGEVWLGLWTDSVHHFSSNWKELRTLELTLLREKRKSSSSCSGTWLFYFTDNMVTYYLCHRSTTTSPELMKILKRIRLLELELGCVLIVIHVPGVLMIAQGTDGLSRGVPITSLSQMNGITPVLQLFHAALPSPELLFHLQSLFPSLPAPTLILHNLGPKHNSNLLHQHALWLLSPQFAAQYMLQAALAWVESPFDSSHIFVVPRIMEASFARINKHFQCIGPLSDLPVGFHTHIPFVLYVLFPFCRVTKYLKQRSSLSFDPDSVELDTSPSDIPPLWLRQQVEHLQRLH